MEVVRCTQVEQGHNLVEQGRTLVEERCILCIPVAVDKLLGRLRPLVDTFLFLKRQK